ncbi:ice-binding family protein [Armatimonas sp.]|uniref:ice-binding family protein n=1 Tax=Armatimonas sp. TaxID=1872638 RepID=UPI0037507ECC
MYQINQRIYSKYALFTLIVLLSAYTNAKADPITLGQAASFGVLAGSTVTNTGTSIIFGNVGVSPGTAITGFPPGLLSGGVFHLNDAVAVQAQIDLTTAYNVIANEASTQDLTGQDLGNRTLLPGVYHFNSSAQLTGALILDALGDPNARFDFQIGSSLTTASSSSVTLINSGGTGNVYWQVGSSATLGTSSTFAGNILALTSITLTTGATNPGGRALARNGAVTLDTNIIGASTAPDPSSSLLFCLGLILTFPFLPRRRASLQKIEI